MTPNKKILTRIIKSLSIAATAVAVSAGSSAFAAAKLEKTALNLVS